MKKKKEPTRNDKWHSVTNYDAVADEYEAQIVDWASKLGKWFSFTITSTGETKRGKLRVNPHNDAYFFLYAGESRQVPVALTSNITYIPDAQIMGYSKGTGTYANIGAKVISSVEQKH